ncbi:MAG: hypothetical protein KIT27_06705 [Legionellales bacterium]|nr:hypothetical protein [Legionellales bacterium]
MLKCFKFILCVLATLSYLCGSAAGLTIPLGNNKVSLDPSYALDVLSLFVARQINCQLIRNQNGNYKLEAAESLKFISPTELQIVLNKNAKFTDGSPVTTYDVLASFNYIKKYRAFYRNFFSWINDIKIIDQTKLLIRLKKPAPQLLNMLASPIYSIYKKSFLARAEKNKSLWHNPIGCGGYKILKFTKKEIQLEPIHKGLPIKFVFNNENQISSADIDKYDLITLKVSQNLKKLSNFQDIKIFDPSQLYVGLNVSKPIWSNKSTRCSFLSKIDDNDLKKLYGDSGIIANDFLPQGTLGYNKNFNFAAIIHANTEDYSSLKITKDICVAYIGISIPKDLIKGYLDTIEKISPRIKLLSISNPSKFAPIFLKKKCDIIIFSLKSSYYDGYEYLDVFADKDENFTGIHDEDLISKIKKSQYVTDLNKRAMQYQKIINNIANKCYIRPLITVPMRDIYVKNIFNAPGISIGPYAEYYLGNIALK